MKKFFIAVALGTGLFAAQAVNAQSAPTTAKKNVATNPVTATAPPARSERTAMAHHLRAHKQARTDERSKVATTAPQAQKNTASKKERLTTSGTASRTMKTGMKKDRKQATHQEKRSAPSSGSKH